MLNRRGWSPSRPAELHDEWQVFDRRYLSEVSISELFTTKPTEPQAGITPQDMTGRGRVHRPAATHRLIDDRLPFTGAPTRAIA
ncbi:hypothetical protein [Streptomyces xinghaiensis]|uniref:hypothetical protein n=1 Tax=Streptomyces xinghaiensis TaxID=1038928 RepID=UPI0002F89266|nr:hypothetical protein [Streptomyces xinghaiensis]MZE77686.1 hypothetical protein [Streptomyces sp. SID5475]